MGSEAAHERKNITYSSPDMDLCQTATGILDTYSRNGHNGLDQRQSFKRAHFDGMGCSHDCYGMVAAQRSPSHETWVLSCD
ncbi:hypothetical protein SDC9_185311 [bioreactor metagenome]|uniref:Uncharacterized protein n=1 Tax=bioreactor metagenome TaxID=1076179 RepID=A0A645HGD5_9ZZZZ